LRSRSVFAQPCGGTEHVADRDRAAEHGGGVLTRGVRSSSARRLHHGARTSGDAGHVRRGLEPISNRPSQLRVYVADAEFVQLTKLDQRQ
jgi:hypothetical protein